MPDTIRYVGSHADTLANGRPVAYGDLVTSDQIDTDADAHLTFTKVQDSKSSRRKADD